MEKKGNRIFNIELPNNKTVWIYLTKAVDESIFEKNVVIEGKIDLRNEDPAAYKADENNIILSEAVLVSVE